jgi:4,5-DOPA dioxygenase extradiol
MSSQPTSQPSLFLGHGNPMNAIADNRWSRAFQEVGQSLARPRAILTISAHWFVQGTYLSAGAHPATIHDFGGFPQELFAVQYPAPGSDLLARQVVEILGPARASLRDDWGLDHGTWSVLVHLRPEADVPVVQLSIDGRLPPVEHLALGRALAPLRDEGVLVLGSGNVTHNLRHAFSSMQRGSTEVPAWSAHFDGQVAEAAVQHDGEALEKLLATDAGRMSHPTLDHFLPLLYTFGAARDRDTVSFPIEGFDLASLSMRSIRFG